MTTEHAETMPLGEVLARYQDGDQHGWDAEFAFLREHHADRLEELGTSEVVYEVEGEQPEWVPKGLRGMSASITIQTPTGTSQADVSLPLRHKVTGREGLRLEFDRGEFVYVSAQNKGEYGSVTCRITVDGVVVSENTASGSYGVATCKGSS